MSDQRLRVELRQVEKLLSEHPDPPLYLRRRHHEIMQLLTADLRERNRKRYAKYIKEVELEKATEEIAWGSEADAEPSGQ